MPFLLPNQQCQSTDGNTKRWPKTEANLTLFMHHWTFELMKHCSILHRIYNGITFMSLTTRIFQHHHFTKTTKIKTAVNSVIAALILHTMWCKGIIQEVEESCRDTYWKLCKESTTFQHMRHHLSLEPCHHHWHRKFSTIANKEKQIKEMQNFGEKIANYY